LQLLLTKGEAVGLFSVRVLFAQLSAVLWLGVISGCGGGGAASDPGSAGPVVQQDSGLLPAAPVAGETLFVDATVLRPLRNASVSVFRGSETSTGVNRVYTNVVTQLVNSAGTVEQESNSLNGGADSGPPIVIDAGAVRQREKIKFLTDGPSVDLDYVELRSPVRSHDRWVTYDKHHEDSGVDLDADRINDALDVAIYSEVVGEEVLDLPNRKQVRRASRHGLSLPGPLQQGQAI
jgi:hypothetical protein